MNAALCNVQSRKSLIYEHSVVVVVNEWENDQTIFMKIAFSGELSYKLPTFFSMNQHCESNKA